MAQEITRPPKKRRRWLRRIGWTLLVLVAVVIVVRVVAGYVTQHTLNERLEALRARGEPLHITEMAPPEVPTERNAAMLYEQAFALIDLLGENATTRIAALTEKPSLSPAELNEARTLVAQSVDALRLLREGAARPECRYSVNYGIKPTSAILLPHLPKMRLGVRLLGLSCEVQLSDGRPEAAAEDCVAALRLAKSARGEPILISQLVDIAANQLAQKRLAALLDRAELSPGTLAKFAAMPSETETRKRFQRTMQGDRCMGIDTFQFILGKPSSTYAITGEEPSFAKSTLFGAIGYIARPIFVADFVHYIDDMNRYVELAGMPLRNAREGWKQKEAEIEADVRCSVFRRPFSRLLIPALLRAAESLECGIERDQIAALAVALRRFRMDRGQYPDALSALAPKYLPDVPADLFSGEPLKYRREGKGFLLYSVGLNGKDDNGVATFDREEGDIVWRCSR